MRVRSSGVDSGGARSEDPVAERDQRVELFPVEPHHPEEHRRREQLGELRGEVARAAFDEAIDEVVDPHRDVVLEPIDLTGREERIEQPAVAKVIRRVDGQRDERPIVALVDEVGRREHLRVPQRLLDERAAARDEHVTQRERARLGQLVVVGLGRRRVGHHFGLQVDEVDPSDGTVRTLRCVELMSGSIRWCPLSYGRRPRKRRRRRDDRRRHDGRGASRDGCSSTLLANCSRVRTTAARRPARSPRQPASPSTCCSATSVRRPRSSARRSSFPSRASSTTSARRGCRWSPRRPTRRRWRASSSASCTTCSSSTAASS